jgi:transcriptional regulator with XRE-family HTH domain
VLNIYFIWYNLLAQTQETRREERVKVDAMRLRELRERRALSLRELSALSGVNYNSIWRIEAGRTGAKPRTVRKLAEALGVEPHQLMKGAR